MGTYSDAPADANYGRSRARSPEDVATMRRRHAAGIPVPVIARQFEISVTSVYRYLKDDRQAVPVEIGGWSALFAVGSSCEPTRLSDWTRVDLAGPPPESQRLRPRAHRPGAGGG